MKSTVKGGDGARSWESKYTERQNWGFLSDSDGKTVAVAVVNVS